MQLTVVTMYNTKDKKQSTTIVTDKGQMLRFTGDVLKRRPNTDGTTGTTVGFAENAEEVYRAGSFRGGRVTSVNLMYTEKKKIASAMTGFWNGKIRDGYTNAFVTVLELPDERFVENNYQKSMLRQHAAQNRKITAYGIVHVLKRFRTDGSVLGTVGQFTATKQNMGYKADEIAQWVLDNQHNHNHDLFLIHPDSDKPNKVQFVDTNANGTPKKAPLETDVEYLVADAGARFIRPNGQEYFAREIAGHNDVVLLRTLRDTGIPPILLGPPGGGKTALAEAAFADCLTINGHGDMTVANIIGTWQPEGKNGWVWVDGPLTTCMREGRVLFVDEGTRIPNEVLNVLFAAMDGRGQIRLDDRPDSPMVEAREGFFVVMGANPDTVGTHKLDEALLSRFRFKMTVETDFNTAVKMRVPTEAVRIARNMQTRSDESQKNFGQKVWVPQMRELLAYKDLVNAGLGQKLALSNLLASCPDEDDAEILKGVIKTVTGVSVTKPTLGTLI